MYQIMTADEAIDLINDGDAIALNSFLGIDTPIELHEALYKRYQRTGSPKHLTAISSAGFGAWDENKAAEGYIRDGAVDKIICGHFGAMYSTKKLVLEDRFEAYNLPLGCISHAIRAQAGGLPGALSKVGLDIFVDPRLEGPGINNISFEDLFTAGDALSICQAVKANDGKVIVQVDRLVARPSRPHNTIIPGCLVDDIVNIGVGIPETVSKYARENGILDKITLTVESLLKSSHDLLCTPFPYLHQLSHNN